MAAAWSRSPRTISGRTILPGAHLPSSCQDHLHLFGCRREQPRRNILFNSPGEKTHMKKGMIALVISGHRPATVGGIGVSSLNTIKKGVFRQCFKTHQLSFSTDW